MRSVCDVQCVNDGCFRQEMNTALTDEVKQLLIDTEKELEQ